MQTMQREMVIITPVELHKIINEVSLQTLCMYLDNYKFSEFRIDSIRIQRCRYKVCDGFLSLLYTHLMRRGRLQESRKLKAYFNTYNIKHLDYGV